MAEKTEKKVVTFQIEEAANEGIKRYCEDTGTKKGEALTKAVYELIAKQADKQLPEYQKPMIINVLAYKGGSGKTTTAVNLAVCLGEAGANVLLIDLDGQGNASQYLNVYDSDARAACIADVMVTGVNPKGQERASLMEVLRHTNYEGVDCVPSHFGFAAADGQMRFEKNPDGIARRLMHAIEALPEGLYDYIILDCAPDIDLVTTNAILALQAGNPRSCHIIPVKADGFSAAGLRETVSAIRNTERDAIYSHKTYVLRTVVEARTTVYKYTTSLIQDRFGESVEFLDAAIPKNILAVESTVELVPICYYAKTKNASEKRRGLPVVSAYYNLAAEIAAMNVLPENISEAATDPEKVAAVQARSAEIAESTAKLATLIARNGDETEGEE